MKIQKNEYDVLCIGAHFNNDILWAKALEREGLQCAILRYPADPVPAEELVQGSFPSHLKDRIIIRKNALHALAVMRKAKAVFTTTGSVLGHLGPFANILEFLPLPPVFNATTGSDINELAVEQSAIGKQYRRLLRHCAMNFVHPYTQALKNIEKLDLKNCTLMRYPYLLPEREAYPPVTTEKIQYLHPTNLDWGETDNKPGRVSTRGNDRFLRAFFRALKDGANIHCTILDRGADQDIAKQMVRDSGYAEHFTWLPSQTPADLRKLILEADIIADAFDVGAFGSIALESMIQAKPVMTYIDLKAASKVYDGPPAILNVKSEEDIYDMIMSHQDRSALCELGEQACQWAKANHAPSPDIPMIANQIRAAMR